MAKRVIYDEDYHCVLVKWMARSGLTDKQIAFQFGVSQRTVNRWKKDHPQFRKALKYGKDYIDAMAEDSLLKRVRGFSYITKEIKETPRGATTIIKEHYVIPDTVAIMNWLKNRVEGWRAVDNLDDDLAARTTKELFLEVEQLRETMKEQEARNK